MFIKHIKSSWIFLRKHMGFTLINMVGLTLGLTSCIIIMVFIQHELSYDRFRPESKRIYRVSYRTSQGDDELRYAKTPAPLAKALENDYPEISQATRICMSKDHNLKYSNKIFNENRLMYADPDFIDLFHISFIGGNPRTALIDPNTVVITKSAAEKYFGNENPVGKNILSDKDGDYIVTGIISDAPVKSHFHYDFVASFSTTESDRTADWNNSFLYTYILLNENADPYLLENKLDALTKKYIEPDIKMALGMSLEEYKDITGRSFGYFLQPLEHIHLHSNIESEIESNGDMSNVYIFSISGLFILVIACINFINLSTALSSERLKDTGIRKIFGSPRKKIIIQYLFESVLICLIALITGLLIVKSILPFIASLSGRQLNSHFIDKPFIITCIALIVIFIGVLAGLYPAISFSSVKPYYIIKSKLIPTKKCPLTKNILILIQFFISIILMICSITIYKQLDFLHNKDLGFSRSDLLIIDRAYSLGNNIDVFREELERNSAIISICATSAIPGSDFSSHTRSLEGHNPDDVKMLSYMYADYSFHKTYGLHIDEGRFFQKNNTSDFLACVFNQAAVDKFGLVNPVGEKYHLRYGGLNIIGVTNNFNYRSLHKTIEPLAIYNYNTADNDINYLTIKLNPSAKESVINLIEKKWSEFADNHVLHFFFLEDYLDNLYKSEKRTGLLAAVFAIIAIVIACSGLIAITSMTTRRKTKEIAIRRIVGANVSAVYKLLFADIAKWIFLANIIAWPVTYLLMKNWLENFAYKTDINWKIFLTAGIISFVLAIAVVLYEIHNAVNKDPVISLRHE